MTIMFNWSSNQNKLSRDNLKKAFLLRGDFVNDDILLMKKFR